MKWIKKVASTPLSAIAKVIDSLSEQTNDRYNAPSIRAVRETINNDYAELSGICTGLANTIGTKTPLDMVGDAYSNESAYAVGEYCIYNNTLYKCNTAITVAEDFDADKWDAVQIVDEMANSEEIGDLSELETTDKTNLVSAINELVEVNESITVTSNQGELIQTTLNRLFAQVDFNKLSAKTSLMVKYGSSATPNFLHLHGYDDRGIMDSVFFTETSGATESPYFQTDNIYLRSSDSRFYRTGETTTDLSNTTSSSMIFTLTY